MDEKQELRCRRQAIRLWLKGVKLKRILEQVHRNRIWFSKWRKRFPQYIAAGLASQPHRPQHSPHAGAPRIVRAIIQARRQFAKRPVGLSGARAIQRELGPVLGAHYMYCRKCALSFDRGKEPCDRRFIEISSGSARGLNR
jgi:hypothetical protein